MRTIYIDVDEEITSAIERLSKVESVDVTFVIPKRSIILQSLVNLKLLKKEAGRLNKNVHILTGDKLGKSLAQQAGIPTVSKETGEVENLPKKSVTIESGLEYRKTPVKNREEDDQHEAVKYLDENKKSAPSVGTFGQKIIDEAEEKKESVQAVSKNEVEKRHNQKEEKPKVSKKIIGLFGGGIFFLGLIFGWLNYPVAKILITPKTEEVATEFASSILEGSAQESISGEYLEIAKEKEQEFTTTGKKDVGEKASGTAILSNSYSTTPYTVVAGTKLVTAGKNFITQNAITVPGFTAPPLVAGTASVTVVAEQPGEEYNIGPTNFTVSGAPTSAFGSISASSSTTFSGGAKKEVQVVSGQDIENAKKALSEELFSQATTEINNTKGNKELIENSMQSEITSFTTNLEKNAEATKFTAKIKTSSWALVFEKSDLEKQAKNKLNEKAGTSKELLEEGFLVNASYVSGDKNSKKVNFKAIAKGFFATKIDKENLKKELTGKTETEITEYFNGNSEILEVKTEFSPKFLNGFLKKARKVEILINI